MERWDANQVGAWVEDIGFASFKTIFIEQEITGDVLIHADHILLRELGFQSVGQRIAFLKKLYDYKIDHDIPIAPDDYVPESVLKGHRAEGRAGHWITHTTLNEELHKVADIIRERDVLVAYLSSELTRVSNELAQLKSDLSPVWRLLAEYKNFKGERKKSVDPLRTSPSNLKSLSGSLSTSSSGASLKQSHSSKFNKSNSIDSFATPSASPTSPLQNDFASPFPTTADSEITTLRLYADGLPGHESESFKGFKVAFTDTCRHLLPVALRKYKIFQGQGHYAIFVRSNGSERCLRFDEKPMLLQKQLTDLGEAPKFLLKHIKQQATVPCRSAASMTGLNTTSSHSSNATQLAQLPASALSHQPAQHQQQRHDAIPAKSPSIVLKQAPDSAVAIYEYQAERDDELNIHIGDRFTILHKESGWCVAEFYDGQTRGWVPEGCLLEENDHNSLNSSNDTTLAATDLPRKGLALDDYVRMSPNEMSVRRGDVLIVQKKYRHWVLAEHGGRRGWVPSCYVSSSADANVLTDEEGANYHEIVALPSAEDLSNGSADQRRAPFADDKSPDALTTVREEPTTPIHKASPTQLQQQQMTPPRLPSHPQMTPMRRPSQCHSDILSSPRSPPLISPPSPYRPQFMTQHLPQQVLHPILTSGYRDTKQPPSRDFGQAMSGGTGASSATGNLLSPSSELSAAMSKLDNLLDSLKSMGDEAAAAIVSRTCLDSPESDPEQF
ncbi:hypothetical protein SeMB42_g04761 [Synchytrium endobioticum]|uniref:Uncharacterized protein n=1 Tax=Synchytrium endobioticum TaxID=286115 RepID=A0A507CVU2_9FUNG|nr:hypothetical protein SeMB42_g04761 [Synchytrium endobioticum]TPX49869.1 hypothetical protein SeLEV6574_g01226 [Synchytrium endobioticum]